MTGRFTGSRGRSRASVSGAAVAAILLVSCGEAPPSPSPRVELTGPPLIVAHYMPWYQTPQVSGSWRHWQVNEPHILKRYWHFPDRRNRDKLRDIASVYYPAIGPYDSADPDLCEYHILLAKLSGIDAFVADWYGFDRFEDQGFNAMKQAAERLDFKVFLCWEDQSLFPPYRGASTTREKAVEWGRETLSKIEDRWFSSRAYLRIAGRPVLTNFAWNDPGPDVRTTSFSADEWNAVLDSGRERPVFIHDWQPQRKVNDFEPYESVMPWGSAYHAGADARPEFWEAARAARDRGRFSFLSGTTLPGFDNRGVGGWGTQGAIGVTDRRGGEKFRLTWEDAVKNEARFIQVATWNDFNEGATVEPVRLGISNPAVPAAGYGFRELETVQEYAGRLKGFSPDTAALRLPAWIYACRKMAAASGDTTANAAIDAARALLLEGKTAEARAAIETVYNAFPRRLRSNPDLAVYIEPPSSKVPRLSYGGWMSAWNLVDCDAIFQDSYEGENNRPHPGKKQILFVHPRDKATPARLVRRVAIPAAGARLSVAASANAAQLNTADFVLRIRVDGETIEEAVVAAGGRESSAGWKTVTADLSRFKGREVEVAIEAGAGGAKDWAWEHAFLTAARISGVDR